MAMIQLNALRLNAVDANIIALDGVRRRGSHAGAPPVVPDVPEIPEEPDVPTNPDVDENGYIIFEDAEVARICAETWGDGTGITLEQAAAVTSLERKFRANANIKYFDELQYFTSLTALGINNTSNFHAEFLNCTNLERIALPTSIKTIWWSTFSGCTKLESINLENVEYIEGMAFSGVGEIKANLSNVTHCGTRAFRNSKVRSVIFGKISYVAGGTYDSGCFQNCTNLKEADLTGVEEIKAYAFDGCTSLANVDFTNIKVIGNMALSKTAQKDFYAPNLESIGIAFSSYQNSNTMLERVLSLGKITGLPAGSYQKGAFNYCRNLRLAILPETLTSIGDGNFRYCKELTAVICKAMTPPSLVTSCFSDTPIASGTGSIYAPDGTATDAEGNPITIVEAYKVATNWSTYASRIFPISQLEIDNPELYAEIEEYL